MRLFLLLLFFASCARQDPWHETAIRNTNPEHEMAKLAYPASNPHDGIQLEFVRHGDSLNGYLSILAFTIPPHPDHPKQTILTCQTCDEKRSFLIERLEGGQKLRLSQEAITFLINAFQNVPTVHLSLGHHSQTYKSAHFEKHFRSLHHLPPRYFPEKLVTFELY